MLVTIAAACGIIYPNSDEEDSISWKLGSNGNLSIKSTWGSLRIKATKVDWLWGSLFIPKHSALDRLSTEAEQLRWGRKTDTDCALCQQQDER
jgi:hypothetical protein